MSKKRGDTNFSMEDLLDCVYKSILNGESRSVINKKLQNGEYTDSEGNPFPKYDKQNSCKVVRAAMDRLEIEGEDERKKQKELFYERYLDVYNECRRTGDRQNAIAALGRLTKLMGIEEAEKIELNANSKITIDFKLAGEEEKDSEE